MLKAEQIIDILKLAPLEEEGGMVRSTYESEARLDGGPAGTAIYYLLSQNAFSHLHRLPADEIYHHYLGDPVDLYYIRGDGELAHIVLGPDLLRGQVPQALVPKGTWQGSRLAAGGSVALLGTTMCPGYTRQGYQHADREALLRRFPQHAEIVDMLTGEVVYR